MNIEANNFLDYWYFLKASMAWWEGFDEARLLIAPELDVTGNCKGQLLLLRHPKSGNKTSYLFINGALQEIHWVKQSYGSWFVGEYVCEDGSLYTATPIDPVFILLPIFEEARMKKGDDLGKFRQLDEIIFINGYPGYQCLFSIAEKYMQVVCDFKVADAVSILREYLKDEPWLKLLCGNLKLDLQEVPKDQDIKILPSRVENNPLSFDPIQENSCKKTTGSGRQTKKARVESQNIQEMFSRASRRR
ncbi:uncharacterized protein LOC127786643 isoform X3 [Diospyros lotus]|uniref:uncharacterized protein LOC127786643 isoform X3 n=1 Tax=Diospyros lotus TaxID=55363 RepID=UPI0022550053|nr:uncharacterized protein LOC127786643 isoform X3 [Diospyros lotus]